MSTRRLKRAETDSDALQAVRDELAAARARLAELADAAAAGTISIATVARAEPQILATIGALERREAELATPSRIARLHHPGSGCRHVAGRLHPCRPGVRSRGCCWRLTCSASSGSRRGQPDGQEAGMSRRRSV